MVSSRQCSQKSAPAVISFTFPHLIYLAHMGTGPGQNHLWCSVSQTFGWRMYLPQRSSINTIHAHYLALCFLFLRWAPAGEAVCKCAWDQTSFWRPTTCGWWYLHGSRPFSHISSVLPYGVDALINLLAFVWTNWWICRMSMKLT